MEATFRFDAELNDFLPPSRRHVSFSYRFAPHQTLKDLVEAMGVPHGEVDLILVNGESAAFSRRLAEGDHVLVYAPGSDAAARATSLVRPAPLPELRFVLDVPLGRLAGHMRLLGLDVLWRRDYEDEEVALVSVEEKRWLLTRDRRLLMRKAVTHGYFVRDTQPSRQLVEVIRRFRLSPPEGSFPRCLKCNGILEEVEKSAVFDSLEPKTKLYYDEFAQCASCKRIYWKGSHYGKIESFVDRAFEEAAKSD
jgi:uncharacterized protein